MRYPKLGILLLCTIIACHHNKPKLKNSAVALIAYQGFDTTFLPPVRKAIESFYHCSTIVLQSRPLPPNAFYAPRNRYKADSILVFQRALQVPSVFTTVGLSPEDISTSNAGVSDWGVLGLGYCPGNTCVVSTWRLRNSSAALLKERLVKIVLHEIGHNLGLPHCSFNDSCMMSDARGTIAQVDRERKWLCPHCSNLLPK